MSKYHEIKDVVKENKEWDIFLQKTNYGQFEQSSMWGNLKKEFGWTPLRYLILNKNKIVGGFQILMKRVFGFVNIGLLIKGPVIDYNYKGLNIFTINLIKEISKIYKIHFLLVQPPDDCYELLDNLKNNGFIASYMDSILQEATVIIDLDKDEKQILKQMKRQKRQNIKKAIRSGVVIKEGKEINIETYYEFIVQTCKRQGVAPNPSSVEFFKSMWKLFYQTNNIQLFLAEYNNEVVSGVLGVTFNDCVRLTKFGWSGLHGIHRPNDLLFWEVFRWAKKNGYKKVDLVTIFKKSGLEIVKTKTRSASIRKSPDFFKLGFGGKVLFLPEGSVYIYNYFLMFMYRIFVPLINNQSYLRKLIIDKVTN